MKSAFPARVIVKRRTNSMFSKPIALLGPPLVDPAGFPDREKYWIRRQIVYIL
jgi:hypothetical protein